MDWTKAGSLKQPGQERTAPEVVRRESLLADPVLLLGCVPGLLIGLYPKAAKAALLLLLDNAVRTLYTAINDQP